MRFGFGKNWENFLKHLDDERIAQAKNALKSMLEVDSLQGQNFIDIGSGSGLMSLAAYQLGANVFSFDYDKDSVACTSALRARFANNSDRWRVEQGSVLDKDYLAKLGSYQIVYSWGVLHHTGSMWQALENVVPLVAPNGKLFIAIYNDQGLVSKFWLWIKQLYNWGGPVIKTLLIAVIGAAFESVRFIRRVLEGKNPFPGAVRQEKKNQRGMTVYYDLVDWVGGYPFEVAKPEEIFDFYRQRGFNLVQLKTKRGGSGCCEYVFSRSS